MPRGQRRQVVHEDETRSTILRTAQELFMEQGYRAVSTRQIADACGLTQPALYHHFADKQDLYVAVMKESLAQSQLALERIVRRDESVEERLKRIVRYLLSDTQHDHTQMMHDIRQELSAEARLVLNTAFQTGMIAPIRSLFEEGIQRGVLHTQQQSGVGAGMATYFFLNMLSQYLIQPTQHPGSLQRDIPERERAEEVIVRVLLYGLAAL